MTLMCSPKTLVLLDYNAAEPLCSYFRHPFRFHDGHCKLCVLFLAWEFLKTSESLREDDNTDTNL